MTKTQTRVLPFLTTHVANVALNKFIGLIFLQSGPQETHGLTVVSGESLANDRIQVAAWMIEHFMGCADADKALQDSVRPWMTLEEYEPRKGFFSEAGAETHERVEEIATQIAQELDGLKDDNIWDSTNLKARALLFKILKQTEECIRYTNDRVAMIQVVADLSDFAESRDTIGMMNHLVSRGSSIAERLGKLIEQEGMLGIMTAYLRIKNDITPGISLSYHFGRLLVDFITPHAIQRGYTSTS